MHRRLFEGPHLVCFDVEKIVVTFFLFSWLIALYLQVTFGLGFYAGMYVSQNYEVPRVDEPAKIWERVKAWTEEHRKTKD